MVNTIETLKDIHLPPAIHAWWPPAISFIIIFIFMIMGSLIFLLGHLKTKKSRQIKKEALIHLQQIKLQHLHHAPISETTAALNVLLKKVALLYFPRAKVAGLEGQAWIIFLTQTSKNLDWQDLTETLTLYPYMTQQNTGNKEKVTMLLSYVEQWIKQRGVQCLN